MLDAVNEARTQVLGLAGDVNVRQTSKNLAEHHRDLPAGQVGAQAEVRAAGAEPHLRGL